MRMRESPKGIIGSFMAAYGCSMGYYQYTNPYFDPEYNPYIRAYINHMQSHFSLPCCDKDTQTEPASWSIWSFTELDLHLLQARRRLQRASQSEDDGDADKLLAACY